ncbi:MAG: ribosome maturation factor RimP [Ruminococcus sp.]|nr:ribosome maturation factor RimP [Ruminococcus sp.]
MEKKNTAAIVRELAQPICDELGLFLWDVRYEKEGSSYYLRVFIDSDEGISIEDCENVTRPLNKALDEADPIKEQYVLEVGSPGLGRELRRPEHFEACIGDALKVRLIRPMEDGRKEILVGLDSYDENKIYGHETDDDGNMLDPIEISLRDCAFIKLYDDNDLFG